MYPSLGPPKDRPRQGPSLKIHKGQAARGGTNELQWQLNLDFQPLLTAVRFFVLHHMRLLVGSARVRGIGRKSWPNALLNFSLIPNVSPVLPKLPLEPYSLLYRRQALLTIG